MHDHKAIMTKKVTTYCGGVGGHERFFWGCAVDEAELNSTPPSVEDRRR
jgi:hypothetical protein